MKILLDTNFLMLPNQFGIDIFEELALHELFTLSSCIDELKKLAAGKTRDAKAARIGLKLIEMNKVRVIDTSLGGDEAILDYVQKNRCAVATNDVKLINFLKKDGVKIARMRQKKYVEIE